MKKFLLLVFLFGALKETMSLDVSEHPELKEHLSKGYHIHHVSAPVVADVVEEGDAQKKITVLVELREGKSIDMLAVDYVSRITPMLESYFSRLYPQMNNDARLTGEELEAKLKEMLVPELREVAKNFEIENYKKLKKDELIDILVESYEVNVLGGTVDENLKVPTDDMIPNIKFTKKEAPEKEAANTSNSSDGSEPTIPQTPKESPTPKAKAPKKKLTRAQANRAKRKARNAKK